ncbi:MAG TPA: PspC domain-containing protein [Streptosporangiaceae bacterium]|jgi:phage shock protein PspC (stress-responsive transcriptional regulator)
MNASKVLVRPRARRMIAGVCAGFADYLGVDVTLIRVLVAALAVITGGAGLLAYLVAWALIPNETEDLRVPDDMVSSRRGAPPD